MTFRFRIGKDFPPPATRWAPTRSIVQDCQLCLCHFQRTFTNSAIHHPITT